jgi:hypothetical protein
VIAQAQRIARAGPSKRAKEAVAGDVQLRAPEADELTADQSVMALE